MGRPAKRQIQQPYGGMDYPVFPGEFPAREVNVNHRHAVFVQLETELPGRQRVPWLVFDWRTVSLMAAGIWSMNCPAGESQKARSSLALRRSSWLPLYRSARVARSWSVEARRASRVCHIQPIANRPQSDSPMAKCTYQGQHEDLHGEAHKNPATSPQQRERPCDETRHIAVAIRPRYPDRAAAFGSHVYKPLFLPVRGLTSSSKYLSGRESGFGTRGNLQLQ